MGPRASKTRAAFDLKAEIDRADRDRFSRWSRSSLPRRSRRMTDSGRKRSSPSRNLALDAQCYVKRSVKTGRCGARVAPRQAQLYTFPNERAHLGGVSSCPLSCMVVAATICQTETAFWDAEGWRVGSRCASSRGIVRRQRGTPAREETGHPWFRATSEVRGYLAQDGIRLWWAAPSVSAASELRHASYRAHLPNLAPSCAGVGCRSPMPRRRCREQSGSSSEKSRLSPPYRPEDRALCRKCRHARRQIGSPPASERAPRWPRIGRGGWPRSRSSALEFQPPASVSSAGRPKQPGRVGDACDHYLVL